MNAQQPGATALPDATEARDALDKVADALINSSGTRADLLNISEAATKALEPLAVTLAQLLAALASKVREAQELRTNAERYAWLRDKAVFFGFEDGSESAWCVRGQGAGTAEPCGGEALDAAVDAGRLATAMTEVAAQEAANG